MHHEETKAQRVTQDNIAFNYSNSKHYTIQIGNEIIYILAQLGLLSPTLQQIRPPWDEEENESDMEDGMKTTQSVVLQILLWPFVVVYGERLVREWVSERFLGLIRIRDLVTERLAALL